MKDFSQDFPANFAQNNSQNINLTPDIPPQEDVSPLDVSSLQDKINGLQTKLAEAEANVLYVKAESENIRRRAQEEVEKTRKFALERFVGELLAVKDSLDAALLIETTDVANYKDGMQLTTKQLASVFDKFSIVELNPLGEKFDPNLHQAISMLASTEMSGTILTVLQKGYTLNERVLRPALVTVAQ